MLVIAGLNSGDFVLDTGALGTFQGASMQILDVMQALGARAAAIPTADIAALQTTTAALAAQSEALIKLAAVPFGDLAGGASSLQQGGSLLGGATAPVTTYITIQAAPGMNVDQLASAVAAKIGNQVNARR
jgi:hypothetical protein